MPTKTISIPAYRNIFISLAIVSVLSLALYVYAIHQIVRNVVARETAEKVLSDISTKNGEMEFALITAENSIDLGRAYSMGFSDVASNSFVTRDTSVAFAGRANLSR